MAEINKSILVFDTPLRCYDCPSYKGSIRGEMCSAVGNALTTSELFDTTKKPDWCQLKKIPKKLLYGTNCNNLQYTDGWNDCINIILGETNGKNNNRCDE